MSFLDLERKKIVIFGVANRKSLAASVAKLLIAEGAEPIFSVEDQTKADAVGSIFKPKGSVFITDLADENEIRATADAIKKEHGSIDGILHSVARANYRPDQRQFHRTDKSDFLQAMEISAFSLVMVARAFKEIIHPDGSVVTISISTTRMASENYGYMAPIKAALDSSITFLSADFARFSNVRFNAVAPGLLKTTASAGIPGYADSYLYAEQVIPRKKGVATEEAARVAVFLLSGASSGIVAEKIVVDAGMSINYFDRDLINRRSS